MSDDHRPASPTLSIRIWDLPTRTFHWLLALLGVSSIVSARLGGGAMSWRLRFGYAIITLIVLHVGAILFHALRRRQNRVGSMLHGDKLLTADVPAALDGARSRALALAVAALRAIGVAAVARLGD